MFTVGPKSPFARCHSNSDRDLETIGLRPSHGFAGYSVHSAASHVDYGGVFGSYETARANHYRGPLSLPFPGWRSETESRRRISWKVFSCQDPWRHIAPCPEGLVLFLPQKSSDRLAGSRFTYTLSRLKCFNRVETNAVWTGKHCLGQDVARGPRPGMWAEGTDVTSWPAFFAGMMYA